MRNCMGMGSPVWNEAKKMCMGNGMVVLTSGGCRRLLD